MKWTPTMRRTADTVIVGSGIAGLLAARELIDAGREVTVIERGTVRLEADRLPLSVREEHIPTTEHNTEAADAVHGDPWQYAYAFGGSSLLWAGVAPRLLPSDFETYSRYGLWRDWPISYTELLPFYREAERALSIAGSEHPMFPGSDGYPVSPPPPSTLDRLLGPLLEPFGALPLARPLTDPYPPPLDDRPEGAEPASSILTFARGLLAAPNLTVLDGTAAASLTVEGGRVAGLRYIDADGDGRIRANRVVLATHGIENPALLMRSGLHGPAVGRWLGDHVHVVLDFELDRPVEHWWASTRDSGMSLAWADGPWRTERASAIVIPFNSGLLVRDVLTEALARGEAKGRRLRELARKRFARTAVVYVSLEDAPREDRFVDLSPTRDRLGLPRTRVHYPPDSDYVERGLQHVCRELERRLAPLGARLAAHRVGGRGGHMLGTCFMGEGGVVDANLRHHRLDNLYIAGGSAFPTHSALHPTTTIAALAIRLGRHLAETAP